MLYFLSEVSTLKNNGFTLVELLVVVAIIAVLAAIIFPVLSHARQKAHQTTCLSNLRQIGQAVLLYAQDYDGCLPLAADWGKIWITRYRPLPGYEAVHPLYWPPRFLPELVKPYVPFRPNEGIWKCPSIPTDTHWPRSQGVVGENETSYFWNHATPLWNGRYLLVSGMSLASIPRPSEAPLLWDIVQWGEDNPKGDGLKLPHHQSINAVFADGHVKNCRMKPDSDYWRDHGADGFFDG